MAIHDSHRLVVALSKTNRFAVWNLMTCSMIFHFKVKENIYQVRFLGDSHLVLLTENSVLVFSFETQSFVEELKLWENQKMAKYVKKFCLSDLDVFFNSLTNEYWVVVGTEAGLVVVWKITKTEHEVKVQKEVKVEVEADADQADANVEPEVKMVETTVIETKLAVEYETFQVYEKSRVKRVKWVCD